MCTWETRGAQGRGSGTLGNVYLVQLYVTSLVELAWAIPTKLLVGPDAQRASARFHLA
jgi:hypothetical protein